MTPADAFLSPQSTEPLLAVRDLYTDLRIGQHSLRAVDGISFTLHRGETLCLVGESGSGKSVTALSVMRLLAEDVATHPHGEILFYPPGQPPLNLLTAAEDTLRQLQGGRLAMIFQEPMTSLNPVFTIGEQIIETLRLHRPQLGYSQARACAIEALAEVQIPQPEKRIDEYPHRLSGGQRQRVMIAMAMACEPDILIADEPTTALDVTVQAEILRLMRALQQRKQMGLLFITHDFGVVAQMAHTVAVMQRGKIVEMGAAHRVLTQPQHAYTRSLIDALPEHLPRQARSQIDVSDAHYTQEKPSHNVPLLRLRGLKVHFPVRKGLLRRVVDWVRAVDGVDLDIERGQVMALVGESGCGKTTLGRAVLRLLPVSAGSIQFAGAEIRHDSRQTLQPLRRRLQVVFQDPAASLNPRLSIANTLLEPMAVHGIGSSTEERLARARQILDQVQLPPDALWRYPHEFSGGQKQRIGIARALVLEPEFIVCDEITSALDVSVQAEILQILMELRHSHRLTLLFITHNIGVVEYLADEMAVMYQGRIIEQGPPDQVCSHPQHPYTQKLLAAVPRFQHNPLPS